MVLYHAGAVCQAAKTLDDLINGRNAPKAEFQPRVVYFSPGKFFPVRKSETATRKGCLWNFTRTGINAPCSMRKPILGYVFQCRVERAVGMMFLLVTDVINNGSQSLF